MSTVRAKMKCMSALKNEDGSMSVNMTAVYSEDPNHENKAFNDATPSGSVQMHIAKDKPAQESFVEGQEYYVDFTVAE